eukprot:scaffold22559_cov111-Cylindrotheca_fusiformis.AAC.3
MSASHWPATSVQNQIAKHITKSRSPMGYQDNCHRCFTFLISFLHPKANHSLSTAIHHTCHEQMPLHIRFRRQCCPLMLLEMGNKLLDLGQYKEAMAFLDDSFRATNTLTEERYMDFSTVDGLGKQENVKINVNDARHPVDTYLEDVEDVGPRPFRLSFKPRETSDPAFLQLVIIYNKALIYHVADEINAASTFYELIVWRINQTLLSQVPVSNDWLHLGMCASNNLGHISYCQQAECMAILQFETSLLFAKRIQDPSSSISLDYAAVLSNWCRSKFMDADVSFEMFAGLEEVLRLRVSLLQSDHPDVASAHFNLGMAEYLRENNDKAMSHMMQYLRIAAQRGSRRVEPSLDPLPGLIYVLLIKNDGCEDKVSRDLVWGLRCLQEKRNEVGRGHSEVACVLNYVGTLLFQKQELDHALVFFEEELRLEEGFSDEDDHFGMSVTCNNIGRILQELGKYPQAIQYYEKALQHNFGDNILSQLEGFPQTPRTFKGTISAKMSDESFSGPLAPMNLFSTVWYNLGLIHDKMGAYTKAIKAFQMSLNIRHAMLGPDHSDIACLLYNIGVLQMEQEHLDEATDSFRKALRIRSVASPGQLNDRHVVKTLQKLASLHKSKGNLKGALEACQEVVQILSSSDEFEATCRRKNLAATLRDLAELYHAQGDLEMALQYARDGVELLRSSGICGCTSASEVASCVEQVATSLLLVGSLYHELCEATKAHECFAQAVRLIEPYISTFSPSLVPLLEVSRLLRSHQCAAQA